MTGSRPAPPRRLPGRWPRGLSALALAFQIGCASQSDPTGEPLKPGPAGGPPAPTGQGIEYSGELVVMESFPVQLAAMVTVANTSGDRRVLEFPDGCIVLLRAYAGGRKAWDQADVTACTAETQQVALEPGETSRFRSRTASAYHVLGDELPDGRYRMTAYLRPGGEMVEIELGETDLAILRN